MSRRERYETFGRCIYCGADSVPLSDEHIIPEALGGGLVIKGASCAGCANETHAFEGHACDNYRALRRQLNFPSKTKGRNARERRKSERFILDVDGRRIGVPVDDFPVPMTSLVFPIPTILINGEKEDRPLSGSVHSVELMPGFGDRLNEIKRKYHAKSISIVGVDKENRKDRDDFGRMLAKIAHSYTVAERGLSGFNPYLTGIVMGVGPYYLPHYIGSQMTTTAKGGDLHEISFDKTGIDQNIFEVVRLRLFTNYNTPAHIIVTGTKL